MSGHEFPVSEVIHNEAKGTWKIEGDQLVMNYKIIKHQWGLDDEGINEKKGDPIIEDHEPVIVKEITKDYFLLKDGTKCMNVSDHNCCN